GETRELTWRDEPLELLPEGLPALREGLVGRAPEEIVREFSGAEGRKEGEPVLLFPGGVPRLLLDLPHQPDGGDVVRCARLPVGGQAAGALKTEVARRDNVLRGGVIPKIADRVVHRLAEGEAGI